MQNFSPTRQFAGFVLVGAASATVSLLSRYFFNFMVPFEVAVVLAQVVGVLVAFNLNRRFVFANSGRKKLFQFGRFALVNVMSLAIAAGVSSLAFRVLLPWRGIGFYPPVLAQVIGLGACTIPSFVGHKRFSFGARTTTPPEPGPAQSR